MQTYMDVVVGGAIEKIRERANRPEMNRRRAAYEASLTFPNDTCGYVRVEKKPQVFQPMTGADRFAHLKAIFEAGPIPQMNRGRLRRGRTVRSRIAGVRVFGKAYAFNGPREPIKGIGKV